MTNELTLEKVVTRRKHLVRNNLWNLPSVDDIEAWKKQFVTSDDQKMAMIILDSLIVRSKDSAKSSLFYMVCSVLPTILKLNLGFSTNLGAVPYDLLRNKNYIHKLRILRLERDNPAGGQSSDNIIRDLRYTFSANKKYFEEPENKTQHVLLVDEFSGSGNQAHDAILDWQEQLPEGIKLSAFFMANHEKGLIHLKKKLPDVNFFSAEILSNESCLLHHIKEAFQLNSSKEAETKLKTFTERNFLKEKKISPLGYKKMALCFKPPYTACNNMAGVYLLKTKDTNVRLFERGL